MFDAGQLVLALSASTKRNLKLVVMETDHKFAIVNFFNQTLKTYPHVSRRAEAQHNLQQHTRVSHHEISLTRSCFSLYFYLIRTSVLLLVSLVPLVPLVLLQRPTRLVVQGTQVHRSCGSRSPLIVCSRLWTGRCRMKAQE